MKTLKNIMLTGVLTTCVTFASVSWAANYMGYAEKFFEKGEYKAAIIQLKNRLKENSEDAEARLLLGKSYLKTGDIIQAGKEVSRAYQLNPVSEEINLGYAQVLLLQRNYKKVNEVLNKKFTNADNENQRLIYTAYAFLGENQLVDAKQIFSKLVKLAENVQVYNGLAKIAVLENELDVAESWLDKSLKIEPENSIALQTKAKIEIINNNFSKALSIYNNLIQKQDNNLSLYLKRAAIQIELKDFKNAEKDVKKVLEKVKNQPMANYMLAQIKLQEKNYKAAEVAAQNVLTFVPGHYPSMLILGVANLAQGQFHQAEKYIIQYLYSNPDNLYAQNLLANVYLAQKKSEQALLILDGIDEEKRAQNPQLLTTLGSAYLLQGDHEKGIEALNQAKALAPDSEIIQQRLVTEQYRTGDFDDAIIGLEKMVNSGQGNKKINYLLIISYIQQNKLEKAKVQINSFLNETPDDPGLYNLTAIVEKLNGNTYKVEAAYNKSLQLDNNNVPAYIGLAQLAIVKNDLNQAKNYLTKVIQINDQYIRAYLGLAGIAEKENNPQAVEKYLMEGFEKNSGNAKNQVSMAIMLGKWYVTQKEPQKLLPIAHQLSRAYPDDLGALSFLVVAEIKNHKTPAEETLNKIINKNKNDSKHRLLLANLLATKPGRESEVLKLLEDTVKIIPDSLEPYLLKVAYLIKIQQYKEAMDVAEHIQNHFPDLALGHQLKGGIYLKQKDYDKALENYQQAYNIKADGKVLVTMAEILVSQGKGADAVKLLANELQKDVDNQPAHFILATLYQKNGEYNEAVKHYQIILKKTNDNVLVLNNLAWIYAQQNNPQALDLAKKAYEKEPNSANIADTYGYILVKNGRVEEGIILLKQAAKQVQQSKDIRFHLAEAYYLNGDNNQAKVILKAILSSGQNFSEEENAKNLLEKISK